jgi:hypothetical protein
MIHSFQVCYVAMNGPKNSRKTQLIRSEEIVDADTIAMAKNVVRNSLKERGFTTVRITRVNPVVKM